MDSLIRERAVLAEIEVICPECGKKVSLRGMNGHLRFEHDYDLAKAKKTAAGFQVDGTLNKLEQEVMEQINRLYELKKEGEELRRARQEFIIGEELYERMITQKGQELTATTRYVQRLEQSWQRRISERTGIRHDSEKESQSRTDSLLGELGDLTDASLEEE